METNSKKKSQSSAPEVLPVIPTMDVVVFPHQIVPLLVVDERIIQGINESLNDSKLTLLLAAKQQSDDNAEGAIGTKDLYSVGTVANIMRVVQIPEGGIKILVQGLYKAEVNEIIADELSLKAKITPIESVETKGEEVNALMRNIKELADQMNNNGQILSPDFHIILSKMSDADKIADYVISHLNVPLEESQALLEQKSQKELLTEVYKLLHKELEVSEVQERIRSHTRDSMNKSQKEFYLREQLKAIKHELGEDDAEDLEKMKDDLVALGLDEEVQTEVMRQINRLEKTSPDSMEAAVLRNYLDWIFALPWNKTTEDILDIKNAQKILDEDHFGLQDVKDHILDFISIRNLKKDGHTPILCFVGPPGTGKTSLGKSIARSLGRTFFRVSLGGVKDEAEIRGHRRTYVGAMPGRFIQGMRKAGSMNPVIMIDELDKIGSDFRGDPSAAMLEVLDPQQNATFYDNYLGVPFDLSKTIFIATANSLETLSEPLKDRMEIIRLSGYTREEKVEIAKKYLIKKAKQEGGLEDTNISLDTKVIEDLIANYTREAGVRQLERVIKKLFSKAARALVENNNLLKFNCKNLDSYLGPKQFIEDECNKINKIGICNGLAWTMYGGEMIKIEAVLMPGKGKLMLTGQLGDVMKESAQAALTYARAHAESFGIMDYALFDNTDLHIHVPAGAVPKDGPSAGITMLSAILSAYTKRAINASYAMTGEVDLQGNVMPIGGVKEKILAAKRNGISHIILPNKNKHDIIGLSEIIKDINLIWVDHADEVLSQILLNAEAK
ncbi:endopeptidase La [candidate division TM6 bacterium RIFCSPHIGHO2_12_FULL_36_22]|nr:MAG: endopeptidase La [candidate division TM6 bacterium RIFCSPHIGHO2_12_FULL_36_22]